MLCAFSLTAATASADQLQLDQDSYSGPAEGADYYDVVGYEANGHVYLDLFYYLGSEEVTHVEFHASFEDIGQTVNIDDSEYGGAIEPIYGDPGEPPEGSGYLDLELELGSYSGALVITVYVEFNDGESGVWEQLSVAIN